MDGPPYIADPSLHSRSFAARTCRALAQDDNPRCALEGEGEREVNFSPHSRYPRGTSEAVILSAAGAKDLLRSRIYPTFPMGSLRIRLPVAAKIALHTAGAIGGVPGSPTPPCASVLGTMYTSIAGIAFIRSIR